MILLPIAGVGLAIKTALLCVLALVFAPAMGVSFGLLRTAVLKIAAVIIFTDAALLWLHSIMVASGAIRPGHVFGPGSVTVYIGTAALLIMCAAWYLFDIDAEDAAKFAAPTAIISQLSNFVLLILLAAVLSAVVGPIHRRSPPAPTALGTPASITVPTTAPVAAANATPTTAALAGAAIAPTPADRAVMQDAIGGILLVEARDWKRMRMGKDPDADALVERMYAAGAQRVYIDRRGSTGGRPTRAYVELPSDPDAQQRCRDEYQAYLQQTGLTPPAAQSSLRRFLLVPIKR
jgi:hypothetical protein